MALDKGPHSFQVCDLDRPKSGRGQYSFFYKRSALVGVAVIKYYQKGYQKLFFNYIECIFHSYPISTILQSIQNLKNNTLKMPQNKRKRCHNRGTSTQYKYRQLIAQQNNCLNPKPREKAFRGSRVRAVQMSRVMLFQCCAREVLCQRRHYSWVPMMALINKWVSEHANSQFLWVEQNGYKSALWPHNLPNMVKTFRIYKESTVSFYVVGNRWS